VVAAGSLAALSGVGTATASHPGDAGSASVLTATSTNNQQVLGLSSALTPKECLDTCVPTGVHDASWAPDGSRAVFVTNNLSIATIDYNDGDETGTWWIADPADGVVGRSSPSYQANGSTVVWAEQESGGHWYIARGTSSYGWGYSQISPVGATADYTDPDGGLDNRIVAERNGSEIVVWDGSGNAESDWTKIADGGDPAISPDGTKVAYSAGGQIWKADIDGANPVALTSDASANYTNPTWKPDGTTVAFNSGTSIRTVGSNGGATAATPLTGVKPAYQSQRKNLAARLSGASRFETAAAVSNSYWKTKGTTDNRHEAKAVVLSRSDTFADALGGSALAAAKEGPLLLTPTNSLDTTTKAEIDRVLNSGDTVYLLGGTGAISASVAAALDVDYTVVRLAGADRYSTAIEIANAIDASPELILVATGNNFPDALGAGAAAGSYDVPGASDLKAVVVLTADAVLPVSTKAYLDAQAGDIIAVGGQAATATQGYEPTDRWFPIVGSDRFSTAYFVGASFFAGQTVAGVATGNDWPDALSGGALMGTLNGPLLLTPGTSAQTSPWTGFALSEESASISTVVVFGGTGVVNNTQLNQFGALISGPALYNVGTVTFPATAVSGAGLRASAPVAGNGQHRSLADLKATIKALQDKY